MQNYFQRLQEFSPKQTDGGIIFTLPVVLVVSGGLVTLRLTPVTGGYALSHLDDPFSEANGDGEYYFRIFEKYDKNPHFGIRVKDGVFQKTYGEEHSLVCAIDEFVRFFICLDDFILRGAVLGNEENFPL